MATTIATVSRLVDGLDVSATPHSPFPEGNVLFAELIDIVAPMAKLLGAKLTVSDGQGGRKPVSLQTVMTGVVGDGKNLDWALALDALSSLSPDDVIGAIVGAVRRLFLDDPKRAERLFLSILSNTAVTMPTTSGAATRIQLGTAEAFRSVIGGSYRRQFALLAFALEVSFKDVFVGGWAGGSPGTSPA